MANLQVRDIDNQLYKSIKALAQRERRSLSQEVIRILEDYLQNPSKKTMNPTAHFLDLSWDDNRNAETLIKDIRKSRNNSKRFRNTDGAFN